MVKAGHKVSFVVCDEGNDESTNGIDIYSTHFKPKSRIERFVKSRKVLMNYVNRLDADVYQLSDPEHISLIPLIQKKRKVVIFNMREYYPDMLLGKNYIPKPTRNLLSQLYLWMMRYYLKKADAVFTVTPEIVGLLEKDSHLTNVYLLANFPVPDEKYSLTKEDYISRKDTVIYEGTIYKTSRQEVFLDALQRIGSVGYLLVGKIDEGNEIIKKHPIWEKVTFVDGFKKEELKSFFSQSTMSNTLRDFGKRDGSLGVIKIFESMEAALPVIFSDVPLYRSIVEKYHCGVCADPNDVDSVESAIRYLIENKEEAWEMGQNGRRAVLEEFNWPKQFETYHNIICKLIKS